MLKPIEENSEITNLMKFLFFKLKEKDMTITEVRMQKLIFKIKMDLGNNHELYDELPYYWYYHGPFSELVKSSFKHITSTYCNNYNNSFTLKEPYPEFEDNICSNFPEINTITSKILKNRDAFYNEFIEYIYKKYAPYKVMYPFRYIIFKTADNMNNADEFNVDKYIDTFYECESLLPEDDLYIEFSDIYSQFSINLDLINDNGKFNEIWTYLRNPITQLWETFASGVRIKNKDDYYNSRLNDWNNEFNSKIKTMHAIANSTEEYISVNLPQNNYTDSQKRILNSTIGSYLRR